AKRLIDRETDASNDRAREGPVKEYLVRYGKNVDDRRTKELLEWANDYDRKEKEKLLERYLRWYRNQRGLKPEAPTEDYKVAYEAAVAEEEGDRDEAVKRWQHLASQGGRAWGLVGEKHLADYKEVAREEKKLLREFDDIRQHRKEPKLTD